MALDSVLLARMDQIADIRHRNLLVLIEEAGSAAELARKTGVQAAYISQVKNRTPTPSGRPRGIGDDIARQLEAGMGKSIGWMDQSELSPAERDLLEAFRALSANGQEYTLSWVAKIRELERSQQ